jgi:hypothetical protein
MRERGQYQLQLMKTRSSSGVGQKIELEFNIETLRITDPDPDGHGEQQKKYSPQPSPNDIMSRLKTQSTVNDAVQNDVEPLSKTVSAVSAQGAKLNSLLATIKSQR